MVPILLYHRIDYSPIDSRYYVTPEKFESEMKLLYDWEYTSITTEMLVKAITEGAELPPRPFLVTIDDGNLDNYTNAFPIMQKYGFTGVLYLVYNYVGTEHYMNKDQILEMVEAGWEVGSHSMNHFDLKKIKPDQQRNEIVESRQLLEKLLGVPVKTFAYPFGSRNDSAINYVHFAKYIAAMSAEGFTADQGKGNLYILQRMEIKGTDDAKTFIRFLPWHAIPHLPSSTPPQHGRPGHEISITCASRDKRSEYVQTDPWRSRLPFQHAHPLIPPTDGGSKVKSLSGRCVVSWGRRMFDQPYQATGSSSTDGCRETTDENGRFRIPLAPGEYILHPESPNVMPFASDQSFIVEVGIYTEIIVNYDSGIR
jgi:peptidoglycan/xylan/chitin deacetylase (PgdA/CDA1 family)